MRWGLVHAPVLPADDPGPKVPVPDRPAPVDSAAMTRLLRAAQIRRAVPLLTLLLVAAVALPASPVAASDDLTPAQARTHMLGLINAERKNLGLVPVLLDKRLAVVAQARSDDMAQHHYYGHLPPDQLVALVEAQGITWYGLGEILDKNQVASLADSAAYAIEAWRNSPSHWQIISSAQFNYAAVGVAAEPGTPYWIWTVLFLQGPDRTGARASFTSVSAVATASAKTPSVTLQWTGKDVQLSIFTAGLRDFQLAQQRDSGTWTVLLKATTLRKKTLQLATGHAYRFRVRARDNAGNWGAWAVSDSIPT
jgi:uncharacterized protein YkwD